ncbi:hypothetical protein C1Y31_32310, partial [Pseudomonas sp. FW305-25]
MIERFLYPKLGPGQLWEEVARQIVEMGGEIFTNHTVTRLEHDGSRIAAVETRNTVTGDRQTIRGDFFFSTMPVKDLLAAMEPAPPAA